MKNKYELKIVCPINRTILSFKCEKEYTIDIMKNFYNMLHINDHVDEHRNKIQTVLFHRKILKLIMLNAINKIDTSNTEDIKKYYAVNDFDMNNVSQFYKNPNFEKNAYNYYAHNLINSMVLKAYDEITKVDIEVILEDII